MILYLKTTTITKTQKVKINKDRDLDEIILELGMMSLNYPFEHF